MTVSVRSYLTAGVAAAVAGGIVLTPAHSMSGARALPTIAGSARAVELAAFDVVTPWLNLWNVSEQNVAALITQAITPPVPSVQQLVANGLTYIAMLPEFGDIADTIVAHGQAALAAPFTVPKNLTDTMNSLFVAPTEENPIAQLGHANAWPLLPVLLGDQWDSLEGVFNFTATPISGVIAGLIGPVLAPLVVLQTSIETAMDQIQAVNPDFAGALNTLLNIPAVMLNAFLNGKAADGSNITVDLMGVLNSLGVSLPDQITSVGLTLGGLLTPAGNGPASPPNDIGGGSLLNSLDVAAAITIPVIGTVNGVIAGVPTGPISSLLGIGQIVAEALGWGGIGNPVQPLPASAVSASRVVAPAAAEATPEEIVALEEFTVAEPMALGAPAPKVSSAAKAGHRTPTRAGAAAAASVAGKSAAKVSASHASPRAAATRSAR